MPQEALGLLECKGLVALIEGSDARYMSTDSGPRPVSIASSRVSAKEPGASIGGL